MLLNRRSLLLSSLISGFAGKLKFANGGDRNSTSTPNPETIFCKQNNIETLWGIGGNNKMNSSSWLLKRWKNENN